MIRYLRLPFAILMVLGAAACASPAQFQNMTTSDIFKDETAQGSPLVNKLVVAEVRGGEDTNPLWTSEVSNSGFRQALEISIADVFGKETPEATPRYEISAELQELGQPLFGIDMTVTSRVHYEVIEKTTQESVFDDLIESRFTATLGDAFYGVKRLRLANEGAIRENIRKFIEALLKLKLE